MEATAVVPEGRIAPEDAGLWTDSQIAPLKRVVDFAHTQASKIGVQLAHAGRKASSLAPWVRVSADRTHRANTLTASADEKGWPDNGTSYHLWPGGILIKLFALLFKFMGLGMCLGRRTTQLPRR